jgi:cytochrome b involved in lipid metabolism
MKQKTLMLLAFVSVIFLGYFIYKESFTPTTVNSNTTTTPSSEKTYSLSDVALHNSESSCWTVVKGQIYDLTAMISTHPSGKSDILKICGIDGTKLFQREHGNKAR